MGSKSLGGSPARECSKSARLRVTCGGVPSRLLYPKHLFNSLKEELDGSPR